MNPFKKLFGVGPDYNFPETHAPTEAEIQAWTPSIVRETANFVAIEFPQDWAITKRAALAICERMHGLGLRVVSGEMGICEKVRQ